MPSVDPLSAQGIGSAVGTLRQSAPSSRTPLRETTPPPDGGVQQLFRRGASVGFDAVTRSPVTRRT